MEEITKDLSEKETINSKYVPTEKSDIIFVLKEFLDGQIGQSLTFAYVDNEFSLEPGTTEKYIDEIAKQLRCNVERSTSFFKLKKDLTRRGILRG